MGKGFSHNKKFSGQNSCGFTDSNQLESSEKIITKNLRLNQIVMLIDLLPLSNAQQTFLFFIFLVLEKMFLGI